MTLGSTTANTINSASSASAGFDPEGAPGGIGLDIETVANLPDADDFGESEFYRENFSAPEIAFSVQQPSAKATFAGLLAAKKAIVKAGAAIGPLDELRRVEIIHDRESKPTFPGCLLSISHADSIAAAVCWRFDDWSASPKITASAPMSGLQKPASRLFVISVLISLIFLFGFGLWTILHFAFG